MATPEIDHIFAFNGGCETAADISAFVEIFFELLAYSRELLVTETMRFSHLFLGDQNCVGVYQRVTACDRRINTLVNGGVC